MRFYHKLRYYRRSLVAAIMVGIVLAALAGRAETLMYVNVQENSWLNVRSLADTEAEIEFCLDRGTEVVVQKAGKYWCWIGYEGREGWAATEYLAAERPAVELKLTVEPEYECTMEDG